MKKFLPICILILFVIALVISLLVWYINNDDNTVINQDNVIPEKIIEEDENNLIHEIVPEDQIIVPGMSYDLKFSVGDILDIILDNAKINLPKKDVLLAEKSESYIGLKAENFSKYVEDAVVCETIDPKDLTEEIPNQLFCMLKINDVSKIEELKKEIFNNCNPHRWLTAPAERIIVMSSGEYILVAMTTKEIGNKIIELFQEVFEEAKYGKMFDRVTNL